MKRFICVLLVLCMAAVQLTAGLAEGISTPTDVTGQVTGEPAEDKDEPAADEPAADEPAADKTAEDEPEPEAKAVPAPPSDVTVSGVGHNYVDLTWSAVSGADAYKIEYKAKGTTAYTVAAPSTAATTYRVTGLTAGVEYMFYVSCITGSSVGVRPTKYVTAKPMPGKPSVTLSQPSSTSVRLTWNAVSGATGYHVYRSVNGGTPELVKTTTSAVTFTDTGLTVGSVYLYEVCSYVTAGDGYAEGETDGAEIDLKPLAPASISADAAGSNAVTVSWSSVAGAQSYTVYRATSSGGTFLPIASGVTALSYTDSGLITGADYYYRAAAVINGIAGEMSGETSITAAMGAPTGFAVAAQTATTIKLSWDADALATGYIIGVAVGSGAFTDITVTDNVDNYTVDSLTPSTAYRFRIQSYVTTSGGDEKSGYSTVISGVTNPTTPEDLEATLDSYKKITLNWNDPDTVDGFIIQRSTNGGSTWTTLVQTTTSATTYADTTVLCGTTYSYRVRAVTTVSGTKRYSDWSNTSELLCETMPAASITAASAGYNSAKITWSVIPGAHGYVVYYRVLGDDAWTKAKTVASHDLVTATFAGLTAGTEYEFSVCGYRTVNSKNYIGRRSAVSNTVTPMPAAPASLTTGAQNDTSVKVSWAAVSGASGYNVYSCWCPNDQTITPALSDMVQIGTTAETSYIADDLVAGRNYYFRVTAFVDTEAGEMEGAESAFVFRYPKPTGVKGLTAAASGTNSAKLTWTATAFSSTYPDAGYCIDYTEDGTTWTKLIAVNDPKQTSYTDTTLSVGVTRMYRIRAYVMSEGFEIKSVVSSTVSVTTKPSKATGLKLESDSVTKIVLTFKGDEPPAKYRVARSTSASSGFAYIGYATWDPIGKQYTYTDSTVTKGTTYYYKVRSVVYLSDGSVPGDFSAVVSGKSKPGTPTGVTAAAVGAASVKVTWNAVANANGYHIQRSTSAASGYVTLGTVGGSTLTYTDTTAEPGMTYYYRVRARYTVSGVNTWGAFSSSAAVLCKPVPPTNLAVSATTDSTATLTWTPAAGTRTYTVTYEVGGKTTTFTESLAGTAATVKVTGLACGSTVTFKVYSNCVDVEGSPMQSTPASVTADIAPSAPTGVSVTSQSTTCNKVTWNETKGALAYDIQRSSDNKTFTTLDTDISLVTYSDTTVSVGKTFYYRVLAVGPNGVRSKPSASVKITAQPAKVTNLKAVSDNYNAIKLTWTDAGSADGYQLYRSTDSSKAGSLIATLAAGVTAYTDSKATAGTTYYYRVRSVVEQGGSTYLSGYTDPAAGKAVPRKVTLSSAAVVNATSVKVTWTNVSGANGYQIVYRTKGASSWTNGGSAANTATTFTLSTLSSGKEYEFGVRAYRLVNDKRVYGTLSNVLSAKPMPGKATGLSVASASTSSVKVTWKAVSGANGYRVYWDTDPSGSFANQKVVTGTSMTIGSLKLGQKVYVKIRAYRTVDGSRVYGDYSATANGYPRPNKVAGLKVASSTKTSVTLAWTAQSNVYGYQIYRKSGSAGTWSVVTTVVGANVSKWTDTSPCANPYYNIKSVVRLEDSTLIPSYGATAVKP